MLLPLQYVAHDGPDVIIHTDDTATEKIDPLKETYEEKGEKAYRGIHTWPLEQYEYGFGSSKHPEMRRETYRGWSSQVLMELCRKR